MPRHARLLRLIALSVVAFAAALAPRAAAQFSSDCPRPLRSRDIDALIAEIAATPAQRAAIGQAMDTYVARWQALRDGTLLRAFRERDNANQEQSIAITEAIERDGDANAVAAQLDAGRMAELVKRAQDATNDAIALQSALADAIRDVLASDPATTAAQREAAEAWGVHERRRTLLRFMGAMGGAMVASADLYTFPRPPAEALADPAVRDAVDRRIRQFERDSLSILERETARGSAHVQEVVGARSGPDDQPVFPVRGIACHAQAELKALADVAALLPAEHRAAWLRAARGSVLRAQLWSWPIAVDPSEAVGDVPAAARPTVDARIAKWQADRDAADAALADAATQADLQARQSAIADMDAAAIADLRAATGDAALEIDAVRERQMQRMMEARMKAATADPADDPSGVSSTLSMLAERSAQSAGTAGEAPAGEGPQGRLEQLVALGVLRRADLESIRARLGLADADRALWDTMATDLMTKLAAAREAAGASLKAMIDSDADPAVGERGWAARRRFADEVAAAEMAWFDAVAGAFPGVSKERIDRERSRRALRRVLEAGSLALSMSRFSGNRWIDTDLDVAADALAPEARTAAEPALAAWRLRKADDLGRLCDITERATQAMARPKGAEMTTESLQKMRDAMARMKRDLDESARRAEAEQVAAVESVAGAVAPAQAAIFRRGLLRQQHPEVYRAQDQLDAAIDKALADAALDGDQKVAVVVAWEESRTRFDPIAVALIAAARDAEAAMGAMMGAGGGSDRKSQEAMVARVRAQQESSARRAALQYDAAELRAHTVRAVRQAIGDAKADAAGVR
jgi:hypothetical protein